MDKGINNSDFFSSAEQLFNTSAIDLRTYSPLSFAFVGDAVFTLLIRTMVTVNRNAKANMLHNISSHYVKAESQAMMAEYIYDSLTDEEKDIYKRGKNAHVGSHARNASMYAYKCATGLETLFGYLYLSGRNDRIAELTKACIECIDNR